MLNRLGQWDKSAVECRESLQLNPDEGDIASFLIGDDLLLNRLDDAKAVYEQGRARKLQNGFPDSIMYSLAFAEGDATRMQQYFDASMGKPGIEDILLTMRSDVESYYGRLGKAREFRNGPRNRPEKTAPRKRPHFGRPTPHCTRLSSVMPLRRRGRLKPPCH